ncbi:uncharacterized protein LOC132205003 isoform X2 [Neocloeon triangulifer]|uniref:uncharacterized protein LOC132205003 isoform X2 n=1 Tax=Neocloeon triangulifer TaxID=2078957 RepID=UPI00286F1607|nr:uncharacterized protein LOC132205003 isoform X2 [Neocloeon triangulifer]
MMMDESPVKIKAPRRKIKDVELEQYLRLDEYTELSKNVEDLAMDTLMRQAPKMPLVASISLLDIQETVGLIKILEQKLVGKSPKHISMLYLLTESVVLSYANPPMICGLFGNGFVNAKGYLNFRRTAFGLSRLWRILFSSCYKDFEKIKTVDTVVVKRYIRFLRSISKLFRDLDNRCGSIVKAIDLGSLADLADHFLTLIIEKVQNNKAKPSSQISAENEKVKASYNVPKIAPIFAKTHQSQKLALEKSASPRKQPSDISQRLNATNNSKLTRSPEKMREAKAVLEKVERLSYHKPLKRPYPSPKKGNLAALSPEKKIRFEFEKENEKRTRTPSFSNSDASTSDSDSDHDQPQRFGTAKDASSSSSFASSSLMSQSSASSDYDNEFYGKYTFLKF